METRKRSDCCIVSNPKGGDLETPQERQPLDHPVPICSLQILLKYSEKDYSASHFELHV